MFDYRKVGKGDLIIDDVGDQFLVLRKDYRGIIVADLQANNERISVPKEFVKKSGVHLVKHWGYGTKLEYLLE